ncbi:MAG: hypothetical protein MOIL_01564 [Candidatus Methanolliviera sp. GoM_oil]|nr:MAG: hypothetical protein MOIL_01564 [Candidatus Methanolliviera sp. GoM_oil]
MNENKRLKLENDLVDIIKDSVEMAFSMGYDMWYKHKSKLEANKEFQEHLDEEMRE